MDNSRWLELMHRFDISANQKTYNALVIAYNEKHRHYHNICHIDATLRHLDTVIKLAEHVNEIEMALWFHDAIYKPFSSTNETDSAAWAVDFLTENKVNTLVVQRIQKLIMATLHTSQTNSSDEELMVDIDLTILGASPEVYSRFEKNIRKEYRLIPYFLFKKKRREILLSFLEKDRIYKNEFFFSKLEKQARINLKHAIASL